MDLRTPLTTSNLEAPGPVLGAGRVPSTAVPSTEHRGTRLDLSSLLPSEWLGGAYTSDAPEVRQITFGVLPLTDSAPIVVAHARGLFTKHGIASTLTRYTSWTASRDALMAGETHAAQMLFGMPVGAAVGRLGTDQKPLVVPWILNRNGQAITLAARYRGRFTREHDLRNYAVERRDGGRPMVFGATLPPGTHAMWLRYWLASQGLHPDQDVALITVPPPQMLANMRLSGMDGFSVGEPWNERAIAESIGYTAVLSEEIWADHPEKVLAFTEEFAEANPNSVKAVLKALHEASVWCDDPANRLELASLLSDPLYIGSPAGQIAARLGSEIDCGDGRQRIGLRGVTFHARNANYPQGKYAIWWLSQFRRWNMLPTAPDYLGITARVMRPDFYEAALKEIGVTPGAADLNPEMLCDGRTFDPTEPEEYAASHPITSIRL